MNKVNPVPILLFLFLISALPACGAAEIAQPTRPADTVTASVSETSSPTLTSPWPPTETKPQPTWRPSSTATTTATPTITPSPVPEGVFALKFYPPLVLEYNPSVWSDESQYENNREMINHLQHRTIASCIIGPRGPSGFYPGGMQKVTIGNIAYEVNRGATTTGRAIISYFANQSMKGSIENDVGIAILDVLSDPSEIRECEEAVEEVLGTLRRP